METRKLLCLQTQIIEFRGSGTLMGIHHNCSCIYVFLILERFTCNEMYIDGIKTQIQIHSTESKQSSKWWLHGSGAAYYNYQN